MAEPILEELARLSQALRQAGLTEDFHTIVHRIENAVVAELGALQEELNDAEDSLENSREETRRALEQRDVMEAWAEDFKEQRDRYIEMLNDRYIEMLNDTIESG